MFDSPEAASYKTNIEGWVSRHGNFYGKDGERFARYDGCTHQKCEKCGAITDKYRTFCVECRAKWEIGRYEVKPTASWDGVAMIYSERDDAYFESPEDARFANFETGDSFESMRLVICEPNYVPQIDADYFRDELPEDGEIPAAVIAAANAFNEAVAGIILSWTPGRYALKFDDQIQRIDSAESGKQ